MADYDLDRLLTQIRRIEEHREKGAEAQIRKTYQGLMKELRHYLADTYTQYAENDQLTYGILQEHGYYARFLEEVEQKINDISPDARRLIRSTVDQTYEHTYNGMIACVKKSAAGTAAVSGLKACTPDIIRRAVENPISKLTLNDRLEKHRKDIVYDIKQNISVGLMNGDRYSTMANRIKDSVEGDYKKAIRIARTETHRVREAGNHDAAVSVDEVLKTGESGMRMTKTWKTMTDERVRPAGKAKGKARKYDHRKMEGVTIPVDEEFTLPSGAKAAAPGQSGVAGEDINCRCYLSYGLQKVSKTDKIIPRSASKGLQEYKDKEIEEMSDEAEQIVNKYVANESKWSRKTIIKPGNSITPAGKEWNCDISTERETAMHILVHEHIHAHSVSYFKPEEYLRYQRIEEASVELLAKEIVRENGFVVLESGYDDWVAVLKKVNGKARIAETDLEFAKKLMEIPMTERFDWLENAVGERMLHGTIDEYIEISELLELLR